MHMNQKKWLDGYSGQTTQQLIALEADHRVDSLVLAFEQAIGQKSVREGRACVNQDELAVLAIEALEREVNNGGYSQFFINSSRKFAPIVVASLQRISCPKTAEITQEAIRALGVSDLSDAQIETAMEKTDEKRDAELERCDRLYFSAPEAIANQLFAYIKTHQDSFRL